jgi:drug/metabolite transporter (DMT)-like permease
LSIQTRKIKAIGMMVTCSLMWSLGGLFIKLLPWSALAISALRSIIAAGVIYLYMRVRNIPFRWNRNSLLISFAISVTMICFVAANKLTTAANATVLQFTAPIFMVVILILFYKQRFRRLDFAAIAFTFLGIALCFLGETGQGSTLGNTIAIFGGLSYGCMYIFSGTSDYSTRMSGILLGQLMSFVIGIPFLPQVAATLTPTSLVLVLSLGVFQLGIPYLFMSMAANDCSPLHCCLISVIEPLAAPFWVFLFHGEQPSLSAIMGSILVLTTVTAWSISNARAEEAAARRADATPAGTNSKP